MCSILGIVRKDANRSRRRLSAQVREVILLFTLWDRGESL